MEVVSIPGEASSTREAIIDISKQHEWPNNKQWQPNKLKKE